MQMSLLACLPLNCLLCCMGLAYLAPKVLAVPHGEVVSRPYLFLA